MPSHTHATGRNSSEPNWYAQGGGIYNVKVGDALGATGSAGSGEAHNNVQPSFVCRYIIKAA